MTVRWVFRALFRQRGGGGDVIVVVLAVASRTMLQQTVAPNNIIKKFRFLIIFFGQESIKVKFGHFKIVHTFSPYN